MSFVPDALRSYDLLNAQESASLIAEAAGLLPPLADIVSQYADDNLNVRLLSGEMGEGEVREALEMQGERISKVVLNTLIKDPRFSTLVANSSRGHQINKARIGQVIRDLGRDGNWAELLSFLNSRLFCDTPLENGFCRLACEAALRSSERVYPGTGLDIAPDGDGGEKAECGKRLKSLLSRTDNSGCIIQ